MPPTSLAAHAMPTVQAVRPRLMRRTGLRLLCALLAAAPLAAAALTVLVNPGDQGEQSRHAAYQAVRAAMSTALREAKVADVEWTLSTDATADLSGTRAQTHDLYVAPAHVVGSALRNGYLPLVGNPGGAQAVLVAPRDKGITTLAQAAGKRLGLPQQDSIVTYLVRGELNAANTSLKRQFSRVRHLRYQDALLICLQVRECDVVGVERAVFERWQAAGEPLVVVMESRPAPGLSVALKKELAAEVDTRVLQASLLRALAAPVVARAGMAQLAAVEAGDFEYVSTLGYFTPRSLPGATVVEAPAVEQMLGDGARYVDVRTEAEFARGHVPGAVLLPYGEKTPKDTDYDGRLDSFDVAKLPPDRATPLIFACNGAECWKSYKASHAAIKAGYTRVHWFRGGLPEWRASKRPVAAGAP